ncbi:MAG: alpha/beta fold hydrolase [Deltaproteobacteria bacterium]|nr:MAG: alpha/beta fold hydrolase [Deltaproteobacteria bacterium]
MHLTHTLFEPTGNGPHPAILVLHGWGANALDLLGLAPYICAGRFLVICPQGPLEVPIGAEAVGYGWFPLRLNGPTDLTAILSAREQLQAFLDDVLARYPINREKLVVLGFSQGGAMAYSLALSEPERFSGLVALSSWLSQELIQGLSIKAAAQFPPTLVQHGTRDELIVVDRARKSVELLRNLRVPVTYREYDMGHQIGPESLADLSSWLDEKVLSPIIVT